LDCPLGVAGVADDSEEGGTAWLERLADLAQEPLVEPEGGQFRPYGPRGGADSSKQHRLNQQQPNTPPTAAPLAAPADTRRIGCPNLTRPSSPR
jgi:hypothetical protein